VDFTLNEVQADIKSLANKIVGEQMTRERLKELEAGTERIDRGLWGELAKANLLGIALPESVGGSGYGIMELCVVLQEVGRFVAPLPLLATVAMTALPIAEFGTDEQQQRYLPGVASGDTVLTAALTEFGADPLHPTTTARRSGDGWCLDGVKEEVAAGLIADAILVPAATGDGTVGVFIVDPGAKGVTIERQDTTSGIPEARITLSGVTVGAVEVLGDPTAGSPILEWIVERATAALCATAIGVCEEALRMTAEYTKTREQFERPIATFQAVGQRAAEAYIDTEAVRITAWQAVWRLDAGLPAAAEVAVAKFWTSEGGQRVVHAAQHLHGGMGVDRDYPLHRYFLYAKQLELTLGGTNAQLRRLGKLIAAPADAGASA